MPSPLSFRFTRFSSRLAAVLVAVAAVTATSAPSVQAEERMYFPAYENYTDVLVNKIKSETVRVDISAWYLSEHAVGIALIDRMNHGVPVRLLGDRGAIFEIDQPTKNEFYWLANQGLPIRIRYNPTWAAEIDHWKVAIFVGQGEVSFGSANFSPFELAPASSTNYKDETVMVTDDTELFNAFESKFDQMWNDTTPEPNSRYGGPPYFKDWADACNTEPTGNCDFYSVYPNPAPMVIDHSRLWPDYAAPPDLYWGQGAAYNDRLTQEILAENSLIQLVVYRLGVDNVTNALLNRQQAGVPMEVLIEPNEYVNKRWPEFEITHANIDKLWAAGVPIEKRVHVGLTHMKVLVTSAYATNASSNMEEAWQRDANYFVSPVTKPTIYNAIKQRVTEMWNDPSAFGPFTPLPPDPAALSQPASSATGVSTTPTFVWNRAAFATDYDVYLGTSQSNMSVVGHVNAQVVISPPSTYSYTLSSPLSPGTTYYWKVVSRTNATPVDPTIIANSSVQSFTTGSSGGGSTPYLGSPAAIPGQIEAENFDNGGEGVAFHDTTSGNSGGAYRSTNVDIEPSSEGGYDVGWIDSSEWLHYSVSVGSAGNYIARLRVASVGGGSLHLGFSSPSSVWTPVTVPNTGGWQNWTTVDVPVTLSAGTQVLTLQADSPGFNINYVNVVSGGGGTASTPYAGSPAPIPGTIEAEDFDNGGEAVAYHDSDTGNNGGAYRSTGVDIEPASEGGYDVGWIAGGEWLKYTVNVASAGNYTAQLRVASMGGGSMQLLMGSPSSVSAPVTIPNTGGWQSWTTVSVPVTLSAGQQILTLQFDSSGFNVNNVAFTSGGGGGGTPAPNVVVYASDVPSAGLHGSFTTVADPTSPNGVALTTPDNGVAVTDYPLAAPTHYVDVTFNAEANTPYRIWLRLRASANSKYNDSVWVQFSDAQVSGSSAYAIGSPAGLLVNLATDSSASSLNGWGWGNSAYWLSQDTSVTFPTTGSHTIRIQVREDGFELDQIVLSPSQYYSSAPGPATNDSTIVPKP